MRLSRPTSQQEGRDQKAAQAAASNFAGHQPSKAQIREALNAVYSLEPNEELRLPTPSVDASPDLLVAASTIPDPELRRLFQEVQQFCIHKRIGKHDDPAQRAAAYKRASQRLEHLPAAPVEMAGGSIMMAPLPGPRGVLGYDYDAQGRIHESAERRMGRYLAMSPHAHRILRQMAELEQVRPMVAAGLEDDPELVRLWRKMGGPRHRHHNLHPHDRQAETTVPMGDLKKMKSGAFGPRSTIKSRQSVSLATSKPSLPPVHTSMQRQERAGSRRWKQQSSLLQPSQSLLSTAKMAGSPSHAHNFVSFGDCDDGYGSSDSGSSSAGSPDHPQIGSSDHPPMGSSQASTHPLRQPPTGSVSQTHFGSSPPVAASVEPQKPSMKKRRKCRHKTEAEVQAEIAEMVDSLYRPLTTVAGQATNELEDYVTKTPRKRRSSAGTSVLGADDGPLFEPSDGEPDPAFAALLSKSPDASADSFDDSDASSSSSSSRPTSPLGNVRAKNQETGLPAKRKPPKKTRSQHSSARTSVTGTFRSSGTGDVGFTEEELLGSSPARRRRSSGFGVMPLASAVEPAKKPFGKFRMERRRSSGFNVPGGGKQSTGSLGAGLHKDGLGNSASPMQTLQERYTDERAFDASCPPGFMSSSAGAGQGKEMERKDEDDDDSTLDLLANTVLSLRQRQQILHKISRPSTAQTSRPGSRSGSMRRAQDVDVYAQAALREVKEGMKQVLAGRRFSNRGQRGSCEAFPWLAEKLGSEALEAVKAFADKWTVDNETASMQALAEHLKQTLLQGPPPEREEAQGITLAAAARRISQAQSIGSPNLDLALGCHKLGRKDMEVVTSAIQEACQGGKPTITSLRARGTVLASGGVAGLVQSLLKECLHLEELDLSDCQYFGPWASEKLGALMEPRTGLHLTHLNLSGCPIQDSGCTGLSKGLETSPHLTHLWLSKCDLTDASLRDLCNVVGKDTNLRLLDLSLNTFSGSGMTAFAGGMGKNMRLRKLYFRECVLADDSAAALANIITKASNLELLDASGNLLGAAGAALLAPALQQLEPPADVLLRAAMQSNLAGLPLAPIIMDETRITGIRGQLHAFDHSVLGEGRMQGSASWRPGGDAQQRGWPKSSSLRALLLSHNPLGCDGVILLLKAIAQLKGPAAGGCSLAEIGLDGVVCDSGSRKINFHQESALNLRSGLMSAAATRALHRRQHCPEQDQEEHKALELEKQKAQQQRQLDEEERKRQQHQQQQHQAQELASKKLRQQQAQELAEQNLPPTLRAEVERERMLQSDQQQKEDPFTAQSKDLTGELQQQQQQQQQQVPGREAAQQPMKKVKKAAAGQKVEKKLPPPPPPPPYFDPALPNGVYFLDLGLEEHRKVASVLVDLYKETGGLAWSSAWLDDHRLPPPTKGVSAQGLALVTDKQGGHAAGGPARAAEPQWPSGTMPSEGLLKVHVQRISAVDPLLFPLPSVGTASSPATPRAPEKVLGTAAQSQQDKGGEGGTGLGLSAMDDVLEGCVISALQSPLAGDVWRLALIERVTNVACVSAQRAARLLACFSYSGQQVEAAMLLLSVCTDVYALLPTLMDLPPPPLPHLQGQGITGTWLGKDQTGQQQQQQLKQRVPVMSMPTAASFVSKVVQQVQKLSPMSQPLGSDAQALCCGTYNLDLGLQSHLFLACVLVGLAAAQGPKPLLVPHLAKWSGCVPAFPLGSHGDAPGSVRPCPPHAAWAVLGINHASACIRNVSYNGKSLLSPHALGSLASHELPAQGKLQLRFLLPTNAAHITPLASRKVSAATAHTAAAAAPANADKNKSTSNRQGMQAQAPPLQQPSDHRQHSELEDHVQHLVSLWEHLSLAHVDVDALSTVSKEVERGQHVGYEGWMGKQEGARPASCGKSLVHSGITTRRPSCSGSNALSISHAQPEDLSSAHAAAAAAAVAAEAGTAATGGFSFQEGGASRQGSWKMGSGHGGVRTPGSTFAPRKSYAGEAGWLSVNTSRAQSALPSAVLRPHLGSSALTGRALAFVQHRVAAGCAWAACFARCVAQMGLDGDPELDSLKRNAARIWSEAGYEAHSLKILLDSEVRRSAYVHEQRAKQLDQEQGQGMNEKKGPTAPESGTGTEEKKDFKEDKKSKDKSGGFKGGKGGAKPKSAKELAAAEAHAKQVDALLSQSCRRANTCLEHIAAHAAAYPVTVFQAAALLQLLPDVQQRLAALQLLLPAVVDLTHVLDLVMCLDAPAFLPPLPPPLPPAPKSKGKAAKGEGNKPPLAQTRDLESPSFKMHSLAAHPDGTMKELKTLTRAEPRNLALLLPSAPSPPMEGRVSSSSGSSAPRTDQPQIAPSAFARGDVGQGLIGMANAIAAFGSKLPAPASAEQSDALVELEDSVQSHLSHVLLLANMHATAAHLGWRWLKLPLASMDEMQGDLVVVLDGAGEVEQLLTLQRLCRFADRCRDVPFTDGPGLIEAATDGGMLELEHEGSWSYWEQILGWACWRPWAPPEPPPEARAVKEGPKATAKKSTGSAQPAEKGKARGTKAGPHPPKLGKVALRFRLTQPHQEWAAATLIQAAWRGWAARKLHVAELKFDLMPSPQCLKELEQAQQRVFGAEVEDLEETELLPTEPSAQQLLESQHGSQELGSNDSRQDRSLRVQFSKKNSTLRGERLGSGSLVSSFDAKRLSSHRRPSTSIGFLGALRQQQSPLCCRSSSEAGEDEFVEGLGLHLNSDPGSRSGSAGGQGSKQQGSSTPSSSSEAGSSGTGLQEAGAARAFKGQPSVSLTALREVASMQSKKASHALSATRHMYKSGSGGVAASEEMVTARNVSTHRSSRSGRGGLLREEAGMLAREQNIRAHALAAASAFCSRARGSKVPQAVAARWQYAWLACKVHRREQRMQLLATWMCVRSAQREMQANADHLFQWPPPEPTT